MADYYVDIYGNITRNGEQKKTERKKPSYAVDLAGRVTILEQEVDEEFARVEKGGNKDSWFKSGGFSDGVDSVGDFFGDLGETVFGTAADLGISAVKGAGRMVEGLADLGTYGVAGVADLFGADEFAEKTKNVARYRAVDEWTKDAQSFVDQYSVLGNKADMISEGLGQVGAIILTGGAAGAAGLGGIGTTVVTTGVTGLSSMGTNMGEAYDSGATDGEAFLYGLSTGAIEAGTELLFGGLGKGVKALGISRGIGGLDDIFAKNLSKKIVGAFSNETVRRVLGNTVEFYVKSAGEGFEEVLSGLGSAVMKRLTYEDDKTLRELVKDEKLLEQFVVGTIVSGIAQGGDFVKATKSGTDLVTGHTSADEKVINKVVEDEIARREADGKKLTANEKNKIYDNVVDQMEHGQIDIDTIESVLGGDTYKAYTDHVNTQENLKKELEALSNIETGKLTKNQQKRLEELESMNLDDTTKRDGLRKNLDDMLSPMLKYSKLSESYKERARRGQAFKADLSKYKGKQREAVDRAVKSGVLNDTYKSHVLVDTLSKIEAEKGIVFDYSDSKRLADAGFTFGGYVTNGFADKSKGTITLNVQSPKAWQSVVGHEIAHVLEGAAAYNELRNALYEYSKSKGELDSRRAATTKMYEGKNADIEAELTADLVGDYLFTDKAFIYKLTGNRTLFQKIFDEIKYLCNTARGKQLSEIEKVKREFENAWKEYSNKTGTVSKTETDAKDAAPKAETPLDGVNADPVKETAAQDVDPTSEADGIQFSLIGETKDGRLCYKSGFGEDISMDERIDIFKEKIATIFNLGAVELKTDVKKIRVKGDKFTAQKNLFGDKTGVEEEYAAKINALYDLADILATSKYDPSETNKEPSYQNPSVKPKNAAHKGVKYWYKFKNEIVFDGVPYTVTFNIRDKGGEQYQYLIDFKENKTPGLSNTAVKRLLRADRVSYDDSIAPTSENVNNQFSLSADSRFSLSDVGEEYAPVGNYSTPLRELALEGDIATLREDIAPISGDEDVPAERDMQYALKPDMSDEERYRVLKTKKIHVVEGRDSSPYSEALSRIDALPPKAKSKVEKEVYALAERLGILRKPMTSPEIEFEFQISKNNGLKKSLSNQLEYGGSYGDFARALINLDKIIANAVLIDAYTKDRYTDTSRADERFEGAYVLLGAFGDGENIIPIKLTIKKEAGETGSLYVVVAMTKIKRTGVMGSEGTTPFGAEQPLPVTDSTYSIQQIVSNVNTADADFLKYIPDGFLTDAQLRAKKWAVEREKAKKARYSPSDVRNDIARVEGSEADPRDAAIPFPSDEDVPAERDKSLVQKEDDADEELPFNEYAKTIDNVVDKAIKNKGDIGEKYNQKPISDVDAITAKMVLQASNGKTDISGKRIALSGDEIWHEFQRHSDANTESNRGQIALTQRSFANALKAIYNPDMVECLFPDGNNPTQRASFAYAKRTKDGNYVVVEAVGGKRNPNIVPVEVIVVTKKKWEQWIGQGKTLGEMLFENDATKRDALNVAENKKNRVTAAQFASNEAIANTLRSPRFNHSIAQNNVIVNSEESTAFDTFEEIGPVREDGVAADDIGPVREDVNGAVDGAMLFPSDEDVPAVRDAGKNAREAFASTKANDNLLDLIKRVKERDYRDNDRVYLGRVSNSVAEKIHSITGIDVHDFKVAIEARQIKHILEYHGEDGKTNHSMSSDDTIAKMEYVLDSPNDIRPAGKAQGYSYMKNGHNKTADTVLYEKSIGDKSYYVVQAVADTKKKTLYIITAFIGEGGYKTGTLQIDDALSPDETSKNAATVVPKNSVPQSNEFVKREHLDVNTDDIAPILEDIVTPELEDIGPVREDIAPLPTDKNVPPERDAGRIRTVKERVAAKLEAVQAELGQNRLNRDASWRNFDDEIRRLQGEYNGKRDKNTKAANDILRRIEKLKSRRDSVDADYEKRISDLEERAAKLSEEAHTGESTSEQAAMRGELHTGIIENIKKRFAENGYDLDKVLEKAKDLSTFATVDNTPQRVMEKSLGYKAGKILSDLTVDKVARDETEGIRWLTTFTERQSGLLAKLSKDYNIKPGSKKSTAAQMYAEGFFVEANGDIIAYGDAELAKDFPDVKDQEAIKGLARDPRIREIYDETLSAINESRARNAYPEIQRLDNYFLHFRAMDDTFSRLGLPFNPNDIRAKDLPTDLSGVTADLKPGQPYFASARHRQGKRTSFDLLGGLEKYLTAAKNQIYHIDNIQTLRALRNYIAETYGQAKGLENLDMLSDEDAEIRVREVFDAHLSTFAKFLNEEANVLAGKTAMIDRGLEGIIGRRGIAFLNTLNRQVGANMVGFNVSSSLTNFLVVTQAASKTKKFDFKFNFLKAFAQTVANKVGSIFGRSDGFAEASPVMIRRKGAESFYRTPWQKIGDAGYVLMSFVDNLSTELIARTKYNELRNKGMDSQNAHIETDKWVSRLMGDRSLGQMPQLYNSKMLGIITKFQLEVRNQLDAQFYDTIQEAKASTEEIQNGLKRNAIRAAKVTATFAQLAVLQHLFGMAFEAVAGYNPAFDIIDVLVKTFGLDDDEEDEDTVLDNIEEGFLALLDDLPYTSTFTGGRIPIASALPIEEFVTGKDEYGNEVSRWETLGEALPYYLLPGGYGQLKKSAQGLGMFLGDHPIAGSYTDSGKLRFPVDETPLNIGQAALFGQYASGNARDYFDNERRALTQEQIEEFMSSGLSTQDYWDYREGLGEYDDLAGKADYIGGLDLPADTKNLFINNIADRKDPIDMSGYGDYSGFEEFDFAAKNPEMYDFLTENGVSYAEYAAFDEETKEAWSWVYKNPDGLALSKAVTDDVVTYRSYVRAINAIPSDKDANGKSITGSRKEKVLDYINGLDAEYGAKIILFKSAYPSDDTYNYEIIDYLNGRADISYSEMETILKSLGFTVDKNGEISW